MQCPPSYRVLCRDGVGVVNNGRGLDKNAGAFFFVKYVHTKHEKKLLDFFKKANFVIVCVGANMQKSGLYANVVTQCANIKNLHKKSILRFAYIQKM